MTNALCTTSRIKNHDTLTCFACGKARDDLYHFLRCPYVGFIFGLPPAFGTLHQPYFNVTNVSRLSMLFESYDTVIKQFGANLLHSDSSYKANKISNIARHVAIKNKIHGLSHTSTISYAQAECFVTNRLNTHVADANIIDAAFV